MPVPLIAAKAPSHQTGPQLIIAMASSAVGLKNLTLSIEPLMHEQNAPVVIGAEKSKLKLNLDSIRVAAELMSRPVRSETRKKALEWLGSEKNTNGGEWLEHLNSDKVKSRLPGSEGASDFADGGSQHEGGNVRPPHGMGLKNPGNKCYINSIIQALAYCPEIINPALKGDHQQKCKQSSQECGLCEFEERLKLLVSKREGVMDVSDYAKAQNKNSVNSAGGDAAEFFNELMGWLDKRDRLRDIPKSSFPEEVTKELGTFSGYKFGRVEEDEYSCWNCNVPEEIPTVFRETILGSRGPKELNGALDFNHDQSETSPLCTECHTVKSLKSRKWTRSPPVLMFHWPRYLENGTRVEDVRGIPLELDVGRFLRDSTNKSKYELSAAVIHEGGVQWGHWYSVCRGTDGKFYRFNDSKVTPVSDSELTRTIGLGTIFFYSQK